MLSVIRYEVTDCMIRACFINAPLTQRIGQLFCKSSKDCKHDLEYSKIKVLIKSKNEVHGDFNRFVFRTENLAFWSSTD